MTALIGEGRRRANVVSTPTTTTTPTPLPISVETKRTASGHLLPSPSPHVDGFVPTAAERGRVKARCMQLAAVVEVDPIMGLCLAAVDRCGDYVAAVEEWAVGGCRGGRRTLVTRCEEVKWLLGFHCIDEI